MLFFLGFCDQGLRTRKSTEQKKFYSSFESRKLSFFNIQMGGRQFCGILNHSGKPTSVYHGRGMQTGEVVPTITGIKSPHRPLVQLFI
jgi:hypothetical protein